MTSTTTPTPPDTIQGDGWLLARAAVQGAPAVRWCLYLDRASNRAKGVYYLHCFGALGWQAWHKDEPVTGYLRGKIEEIIEPLVEELRASEVEDKLAPPRPQQNITEIVRERNYRKWRANEVKYGPMRAKIGQTLANLRPAVVPRRKR